MRSRPIARRRWKSAAMGTSPNPASHAQWWLRCSGSSAKTMGPKDKSQYRILVVDDHEDNIELLRARLEARGYIVEGAGDGQAALDAVERQCPDLILLDVMMPKLDGIEVVRRLDRKSTRLNSSHLVISYAVFCLKKKKNE